MVYFDQDRLCQATSSDPLRRSHPRFSLPSTASWKKKQLLQRSLLRDSGRCELQQQRRQVWQVGRLARHGIQGKSGLVH